MCVTVGTGSVGVSQAHMAKSERDLILQFVTFGRDKLFKAEGDCLTSLSLI